MWIQRVRWMHLGAVLVELPAGWKRSKVPPAGKGKEGEERGASPAALKGRHLRDGRPEPTVKAQSVFGTNKLVRWSILSLI